MTDNPSFDEDDLVASICKDSFYFFLQEFWSTIIREDPVWNWHIEYLCNELQKVAENLFKKKPKMYDLLINIPPGSTKSTIVSVMFPAWVWLRLKSARFICVTHTSDLTEKLAQLSKDVIKSEKFQRVFPNVKVRKDVDAKKHFKNYRGGERISTSVGAKIIGSHAHFIIIDDPIDPEQALSEKEMKRANRFIKTTLPSRKVSKERSVMILLMQRLHQNDPSAVWVKRKEEGHPIKHICLPGRKSIHVKPGKLKRRYKEGLLDPVRMSEPVLKGMEAEMGQYAAAGQIGQHPIPAGGGMFKTGKIRIEENAPTRWKQKIVRYWDKAGTEGGGARSAGVKIGEDMQGKFWILHVFKGQWGTDEREANIVQTAESDGKEVIIGIEQEPGSGGKESAEGTVGRLAGYVVKVDRPVGNKVTRADPFSVQVNWGNVRMLRGEWNSEFLDEMMYFPNSTFKDQVDSGSAGFALLTKKKKKAGALFHGTE